MVIAATSDTDVNIAVYDDAEARAGLYGPVVPVPGNAPLLDRLLGQTGRDPRRWP